VLVLTIAGVEKIIEYNNLAPQTDLSQPGQIIPFVLGIVAMLEGIGNAFMPIALESRQETLDSPTTVTSFSAVVKDVFPAQEEKSSTHPDTLMLAPRLVGNWS